MKLGLVFVASAGYLTLLTGLVMAMLEPNWDQGLARRAGRKWGKFLLGLAGLGIVVQVLTWVGGG